MVSDIEVGGYSSDANPPPLPALTTIHRDLDPIERFSKQALLLATTTVINNTESLELANNAVVELTSRIKQVKDRMDFFTKPIKQHTRLIDGVFKAIIDPLTQANDAWRTKIVKYRLEQQEAQRQVQEILSEQEEKVEGSPSLLTTPVIVIHTIEQQKVMHTESGQKIVASQNWDFTIQDYSLIPESILRDVIHTARGREALESVIRMKVKSGVRKIDGVRIFPSEQLSVRG